MSVYTNMQAAEHLSDIQATDTLGVLGTEGAEVVTRALIDTIAERVMTKLLEKSQVVNNLFATEAGNVLDATQGKVLKDQLNVLNSNFNYSENDLFIGPMFRFCKSMKTDFNDIGTWTDTCAYISVINALSNNRPSQTNLGGLLFYIGDQSSGTQFFIPVVSTDLFIRRRSNSQWDIWILK